MEFIGIIVAIVGFVFSYLENEKKKQKQNEKPTQMSKEKSNQKPKKPPVIIENPFKPLEKTDNTNNTTLENIRSFLGKEEKKHDSSSQEIEDLKRQNASLQKKLRLIEQQRLAYNKTMEVSPEAKANTVFTKENVVEAVVFSEVLSAPRAKNPHYSYRKPIASKSK